MMLLGVKNTGQTGTDAIDYAEAKLSFFLIALKQIATQSLNSVWLCLLSSHGLCDEFI
jgi:hypothetical protein